MLVQAFKDLDALIEKVMILLCLAVFFSSSICVCMYNHMCTLRTKCAYAQCHVCYNVCVEYRPRI